MSRPVGSRCARAALGLALLCGNGPAFAQGEAAPVGISAPVPLEQTAVPYPEGASGAGSVLLEIVVGEDGSVSQLRVVEGQAPFSDAAVRYAKQLTFKPALRDGLPLRVKIAFRVNFQQPVVQPVAGAGAEAGAGAGAAAGAGAGAGAAAVAGGAAGADAEATQPLPVTSVVVRGEQRSEPGSIYVPREDARRVPGAFGDPFRVVEVLPGVAPVLSGLPYFFVRGASPGSVGYFIDGVRVPLLFHVGSGPSVIAPALVDRVDLFPGAYPARFGGFAGAVLSGETLPPSQRPRFEAQARVFDASAFTEQPFAEGKGSVAVGARYSYTQLLIALVAPEYELGYGDYQARVSYQLTARDRLTLFGFGGFDELRNVDQARTLFDVAFNRVDLRWDRHWQDGRFRLAATHGLDRIVTAPDDPGAAGSAQKVHSVQLRSELEQDLASEVRLRLGGAVRLEGVRGDREQVDGGFVSYPDRSDGGGSAYLDVVWRPLRAVEVIPGVRGSVERSREKTYSYAEPRLATRTRLMRGLVHLAGFGIAHQLPAVSIRMPGRRPDFIERSEQMAVQAQQGFEYALPAAMLGRTTLFHQWVEVDTPYVHGRSYGVEQFLRRNFSEDLGGFVSYTLSRAQGTNGRWTGLSSHDHTHVLSAVLGYDFGFGYRLGTRAYYASGRPYEIDCPTPDCGPGDPLAPRRFTVKGRLPDFFRLDLRFEKRWRFQDGWWLTAAFEWFNALMADEVEDILYSAQGLQFNRQSPITLPSVGVEVGY